jgi:hypothetical protein
MGRRVCCSSLARAPQHGTYAQRGMACRLRFQHSSVIALSTHRITNTFASPLPPLRSGSLREPPHPRIRGLHDSLRAEDIYVYWVRLFSRWMSGCASHGTRPRMAHTKARRKKLPGPARRGLWHKLLHDAWPQRQSWRVLRSILAAEAGGGRLFGQGLVWGAGVLAPLQHLGGDHDSDGLRGFVA